MTIYEHISLNNLYHMNVGTGRLQEWVQGVYRSRYGESIGVGQGDDRSGYKKSIGVGTGSL